MNNRILDFSQSGARLNVRLDQLIIARQDEPDRSIPLEDVAVMLASNRGVSYSNAVLSGLAAKGGLLVVCDEFSRPAAMLLPLEGNSLQAERFAAQASSALPVRKRLWRSIIKAKIGAQALLLSELRGSDSGLDLLAARVRSGDPDNIEAQAARIYWRALFADPAFRRDPDSGGVNGLLNYGYAVLRAAVTRAICSSGLHPAVGLHHHNRYNPFPLADDLMEPFRPLVDRQVAALRAGHGPAVELTRELKASLLSPFTGRLMLDGQCRTLFEVLTRMTASLVQVFHDERKDLVLPDQVWIVEEEAGDG